MSEPESLDLLRTELRDRIQEDTRLLEALRQEVRPLRDKAV
jgi:hypothetical protein